MVKIYRHNRFYHEFESATRFINVEYVANENECDYVAVACSDNSPVFEGITKPILYSYIREHPYTHDEYLQTQFESLQANQDITIFSLSSFEHFAPGRKNVIIDQFELDAYDRLFIKKECPTIKSNFGTLRFLLLGGKANKQNRKPLLDLLIKNDQFKQRLEWSMFGIKDHLDDITIEDNHYIGYPYDSALYQRTNFSIVSETHFDGNQEFHPTEKTYRAIANMHPFAILTTPYFLVHLKEKGYQTFSTVFDEKYDIIKAPHNRLTTFVNALYELNQTGIDYRSFENIAQNNVNTLIHNAKNTREIIRKALK